MIIRANGGRHAARPNTSACVTRASSVRSIRHTTPRATKKYCATSASTSSMNTLAVAVVPSTPCCVRRRIPTISPPILATGSSRLTAWRMVAIKKSTGRRTRAKMSMRQPRTSRKSGHICRGMSKSRIQPARESRVAIVPAPSIAMSAITTPKPRANAIRTLIFTQLRFGRAPLERDVACDDDNRHYGCTDARCDKSGTQPAKPREGCQQEQRVVRMEALHPVPCLDSGRAELFEHLRTPDAKQHRTAAEQPDGHGRVAEPAVAPPDPGAEK